MSKKIKYYDDPYQTEYLNALQELERNKNREEQEVAVVMAKICAFFMALGVIYLLFKK